MTAPSPVSDALNRLMRSLPSMNAVLDAMADPASSTALPGGIDRETASLCASLTSLTPRPLLREAVESFCDARRADIRQGRVTDAASLSLGNLLPSIARHAAKRCAPHLRRVVNATGVVIHTNLGRSLLAEEAVTAVTEAARDYSTLEFDLETGERGSRQSHIEDLVCRLTGAEAAIAVNNNAAAVLLVLDTLCKGREVVVSRGELVEIGGSFRIPAVMEKSGCILHEVGATNRTHIEDYAEAVTENTAALMKVHTSNYRIVGFYRDVHRAEMAALAREKGLPLIEDLGSGVLYDMASLGVPALSGEPTVRRVLAEGVDVVTFSGDKVLGGPQAGIIAGRADYIARIRKNQLHRAMRSDKMTLAALEATLRLYTDPELAKKRVPTLRMICMDKEELRRQAGELAAIFSGSSGASPFSITVREGESRVGGGSFPEHGLPTFLVCVHHDAMTPNDMQRKLLEADTPVLARVEKDEVCFDPRTLRREEYGMIAEALRRAVE